MKELNVHQWVTAIDHGLKFRAEYGLERSWAEVEALFYQVQNSQLNAGPNIIMSTGDSLLSTLNVPAPYLTLKARRPESINPSRMLEQVDNMLIDDMRMPVEVENAILSTYLFGTGFIKIGFDSEYGWDPTMDLGGRKMPLGLTATSFDSKGNRIEFDDTQPGMPWVKSVLPHDIVVPWGTRETQTAEWIAHRVVRHIDDIKADAKYENTADLHPTMSMEDFTKSYQSVIKPYRLGKTEVRSSGKEGYKVFCELWEIHDRRTGKIYVIATDHWEFLRNEHDFLQLEGLPFVGFTFTPRSRNLWTTSDAYYLRQCQAELSDITMQQTKLRRIMVCKWLVAEGAIDETEISKMCSFDVGSVVKIKQGFSLEESVKSLTAPPNPELENQAQIVFGNARENVGLSRNQQGQYEPGRKTATEANIVSQSADLRISRREQVVRDLYVDIFKRINPIITEYWRIPRILQIVGSNGVPQWISFTGQHLRGEYEYGVGFSPNADENTLPQRRQAAIQAFQLMSQIPTVDPIALARYVANAYNDPEFSSIFKPGVLQGLPSAAAATVQMQQGQASPGGGQQASRQPPMPAMQAGGVAGGG